MSDITKDLESVIITMTCETVGAVIYYTLDNSEPSLDSTEYTAPFKVSEPLKVKAKGFKEGLNPSDVSICAVSIKVSAPIIKLENNKITIICATSGARIFYTADGTEPTVNSTEYITAFQIAKESTIKAFAVNDNEGWIDSDISTFEASKAPIPKYNYNPSTRLFSINKENDVAYTIEQLYLSMEQTTANYSEPMTIADDIQMLAITAQKSGYLQNQKTLLIPPNPAITIADSGNNSAIAKVVLDLTGYSYIESLLKDNGGLYYSLDGNEPTTNSGKFETIAGGEITITESATIKVKFIGSAFIVNENVFEALESDTATETVTANEDILGYSNNTIGYNNNEIGYRSFNNGN